MTEPRVHLRGPLVPGTTVVLPETAFRHVVQVLRMGVGDRLAVFDGHGGEYDGELLEVGRRSASVRVGAHRPVDRESPLRICLAQGISKGDRMDYTLQKAVELGVAEIVPLVTERCVVRLDAERWRRKLEHWRGVVAAACEQSGRTRLPPVHEVRPLAEWLREPLPEWRLVLAPAAQAVLPEKKPAESGIVLLVGPEGGLSETEIKLAGQAGFRTLRLGPRVLRTETAGVAAIAVLQARWGDLA